MHAGTYTNGVNINGKVPHTKGQSPGDRRNTLPIKDMIRLSGLIQAHKAEIEAGKFGGKRQLAERFGRELGCEVTTRNLMTAADAVGVAIPRDTCRRTNHLNPVNMALGKAKACETELCELRARVAHLADRLASLERQLGVPS